MAKDPWDDLPAGNFMKFDDVGDEIAGDVIGKGIDDDFNGNPVPSLTIRMDDEEVMTVTAGWANLRAQLLAAKPQVGDRIKITFTHEEPPTQKGRSPKKVFDVKVKSGGAKGPIPEPEEAAAPAPADDDDF